MIHWIVWRFEKMGFWEPSQVCEVLNRRRLRVCMTDFSVEQA